MRVDGFRTLAGCPARGGQQNQIEQSKLFHRHKTSKAQSNRSHRHPTAGYTLRVFKREESDQSGAMPREERHAERRERRGSGSENLCGRDGGQSPRHERRNLAGKIVLGPRRSDGHGQRLGVGGCGRDTAIQLLATAAHADGLGREERGWGRRHRLKPEEHQAQNDGGCPFHAITLTRVVPARSSRQLAFSHHFLSAFPALASFLTYFAGSFLKSFWQDLQHSLISWPS